MGIGDFEPVDDGRPKPPGEGDAGASVAEGHRLVIAFTKIRDQADRRAVIDLTEWLGKLKSS